MVAECLQEKDIVHINAFSFERELENRKSTKRQPFLIGTDHIYLECSPKWNHGNDDINYTACLILQEIIDFV